MQTASTQAESVSAGSAPRVWVVIGDKLGDNAQIDKITERLGWHFDLRRMQFKDQYILGKPNFRPSLHHVDIDRSDPLTPPWPDLILTVGRRPSMVALWIRERSGGQSKIVIVGRPRRRLHQFALVVATPQYQMPDLPNVLNLNFPLMRVEEARIAEAAEAWRARLQTLQRPLTAVLVGGPTKPFVFDGAVARHLIELLAQSSGNGSGTLFVTTSRRTPAAVVEAFRSSLPASARLFEWKAGASDNPYLALLGLADRFVVTGDSISMMTEVAGLGKPLAIFPLPARPTALIKLRGRLGDMFYPPESNDGERGALAWLGDILYDTNLFSHPRDLSAVHRELIASGLAMPLGEPFPTSGSPPPDEVPKVVERIRSLISTP